MGAALTAGALIGASLGATAATVQAADEEVFSETFSRGASSEQTSFTIPPDATSVQLVVAGDQGASRAFNAVASGGAGGVATVDLGTAYNGETLSILVGTVGPIGQAGGAFVALGDEFLVIAGGGGQGGEVAGTPIVLSGGAAGLATASLNGAAGEQYESYHQGGLGAVSDVPGDYGYAMRETQGAANGSTATIVDGLIKPGMASTRAVGGRGYGLGGQGYAGGGGGLDELVPAVRAVVRGSAGGASSYVAPGLRLVSTGSNHSAAGPAARAYVTVTWTMPAEATDPGEQDPGEQTPGEPDPGEGGPDTDEPGVGVTTPSRPVDGIVLPIVAG